MLLPAATGDDDPAQPIEAAAEGVCKMMQLLARAAARRNRAEALQEANVEAIVRENADAPHDSSRAGTRL